MVRISDVRTRFVSVCLAAVAIVAFIDYAQAAKGFTTVYNFCQQAKCADGAQPHGALMADGKGNLFGTTSAGGGDNLGTVFEENKNGETVLWSFSGGTSDGANPSSTLIMDKSGNLYGTATKGGYNGYGIVFELPVGGNEEYLLYDFCNVSNCTDGAYPYAGVIADNKGILYGTTVKGGANGDGTVFSLDPSTSVETALYSFCTLANCTDGDHPIASLIRDAKGDLYGTTQLGGQGASCSTANTCGTVFKLAPPAKGKTTWTETVLYSFCAQTNCSDGSSPQDSLVEDTDGNLYGTTEEGGGTACTSGCETVFELTPKGKEKVLYTFCTSGSCSDGASPMAALLLDSATGTFYGTTWGGGPNSQGNIGGTVFSLSAAGKEKVLHGFTGGDGTSPQAGVILENGYLYGTTPAGGANQSGTVFKQGTAGGDARK